MFNYNNRFFSILANETTDISDKAELATSVRYIDSNSHDVNKELLGLVQIKGNKGTAQICGTITKLFMTKVLDWAICDLMVWMEQTA